MPTYSDPTAVPAAVASMPIRTTNGRLTVGPMLVLLAGLLSVGLAGYMYYQVQGVTSDTQALQSQTTRDRASFQAKNNQDTIVNLNKFQALSNNLKVLFSNQIRWEDVLQKVQGKLYRRVSISSIQVGDDGQVTLSGTTPSFVDYAKLNASLNDATDVFSSVLPQSTQQIDDPTIAHSDQMPESQRPKVIRFTFQLKLSSTLVPASIAAANKTQ